MRVRMLGPVDVVVDGRPQPVPGQRRQALLAALALHHGTVVSVDRLAHVVWGDSATPTPVNTVQRQVSHLRRILGRPDAIVAAAPGYRLTVGPDGSDVVVAERLIRGGGLIPGDRPDPARRVGELRDALALWRGPSLAELGSLPWFAGQAERLDALRGDGTVALFEARLALGQHGEIVAELEASAVAHPFDERIHELLITALYRAGRQADALSAYRRVRVDLAAELGIDPGPRLRDLEAAVLRQDPALDPPAQSPAPSLTPPAGPPAPAEPRELPADVFAFTGRRHELATLDRVRADADASGIAAVSVITGAGGVGKTALALRWAHRVAPEFPDGQLYLDLRGAHPDDPVRARDALAMLLESLGVPRDAQPNGSDARSARYRSLLAGRRMLVVLDNAWDAAQVRPLLPGSSSCCAVVTSRTDLAGLVARDGARRVPLDVLTTQDATDLVRTLVAGRVAAEPAAAGTLIDRCGRLPLALRIMADVAATRPDLTMAALAAGIADERTRFDLLDAGSGDATDVRTVFSWTERHLPARAVRVFRLLGLHPGTDIDTAALAALTALPGPAVGEAIAELTRVHLIERTAPDRFRAHDLLRAYAADRARRYLDPDDRRAAVARLNAFYLDGAATDDRAWLDRERANLVAVATAAPDDLAVAFARALTRYLHIGYHNADALAVHKHALDAALRTGDASGAAAALNELGRARRQVGDYVESTRLHQEALDRNREIHDRHGAARNHQALGIEAARRGDYPAALVEYRHALALYRDLANRGGEATALAAIGQVHWIRGDQEPAIHHFELAATAYVESGDRLGQGRILNDQGNVHQRRGDYARAVDCHSRALEILRDVGDPAGEACSLLDLGRVRSIEGRHDEALGHHEQALAIFRRIDDPLGEAEALVDLGDACHRRSRDAEALDHFRAAGELAERLGHRQLQVTALNGQGRALLAARPANALARHTTALNLALDLGDPFGQARAHDGWGDAAAAAGDAATARRHWADALALYEEQNASEAAGTRAKLRTAGDRAHAGT